MKKFLIALAFVCSPAFADSIIYLEKRIDTIEVTQRDIKQGYTTAKVAIIVENDTPFDITFSSKSYWFDQVKGGGKISPGPKREYVFDVVLLLNKNTIAGVYPWPVQIKSNI